MPKQVTVTNGVMEWSGKTMREAQAKRDEDLNRLFAKYGAEVPIVIVAPPHLGMVFQQYDGYFAYRICFDGAWGCVHSGTTYSKIEAEWHCRHHLAQAVYRPDGPDGLDVIAPDDIEGLRDHRGWIRFQTEYRKARDEGVVDSECHRLACERASAAK